LGVSVGRWRDACSAARALKVTSLDQARPGFEGEGDGMGQGRGLALVDLVADPVGLDPLERACGLERQQRLNHLLGQLAPRSAPWFSDGFSTTAPSRTWARPWG
jgi:hypothetical protein